MAMSDIDALARQIQNLERENRKLRSTLRDDFAKSALGALVGVVGSATVSGYSQQIADVAWELADAMMEARRS